MGLHTADAIVLRRYLYRETSVIVTCLTDRFGKLKGLVKGLRVYPSRHRSAMEQLTINRIVFYDTNHSQLHLITQCELLASLPELQRDLETARDAAFCIELADAIVPLEEPHPATYQLVRETLERLALGLGPREQIRTHFIVRLLRLAGFQPQLDHCTGCNRPIEAQGFWSARQGGLLCAACLHEDPKAEPATPMMLDALRTLSQSTELVALEPSLMPVLRRQLDTFLHWRLDRPLKTMSSAS